MKVATGLIAVAAVVLAANQALAKHEPLGNLNAAHANEEALEHANPHSRVGDIATYQSQMQAAQAMQNQAQRNAAIAQAQQQLAQTSNKPLTPGALNSVNSMLGLNAAPAHGRR